MTVYMAIGEAPLYLPLAVADTYTELAKLIGKDAGNICKCVKKSKQRGREYKYIGVDIDDE